MTSQNKDILELLAVVFLGVSFWLMSFGQAAVNETVALSLGNNEEMYNSGLVAPPPPVADTVEYDRRLRQLAHLPAEPAEEEGVFNGGETEPGGAGNNAGNNTAAGASPAVEPSRDWPVRAAYPQAGAILPFKRIVAYYGNFYSTRMGVLGQYAESTVISMLDKEVAAWEKADPDTPVQPAVDYIAIVAQAGPGQDGKYRLRMPDDQVQKALDLAAKIDGIVILEVQAGLSDIMTEIKSLEDYLIMPQVHLAIDPEFAMKRVGVRPGLAVGTVSAAEVNEAIDYLAELVRIFDLPPKVLVVHRYTRAMVTEATEIRPRPEVQVVMDMDGWGPPSQKYATYNAYIRTEPVQFTGFKLFYRNDTKTGVPLLRPEQVLRLMPKPIFIQYQ